MQSNQRQQQFDQGLQNQGSLLRLFQSEYFTTEMLIEYFHRNFNDENIHKYLINKLYQTKDEELEFYVTQIVYMTIKKDSRPLEKFLTDKCAQNRTLYLLIYWCFQAYGESAKEKDPKIFQKIDKLERMIEMAHVNGEIHIIQQSLEINAQNIQTKEYEDKMLRLYLEKSHRAMYNDGQQKFINNLIKISLSLKQIPIEDRKQRLKCYMKKANRWIEKLRVSNKDIEYFYGLAFPFQQFFNEKAHSNYIVNILENELACFNTKERVPYKIVVETIDIEDLKNYEVRENLRYKNKSFDDEEQDFDVEGEVEEKIFNINEKYQGFASWAKSVKKEEKQKNGKKSFFDQLMEKATPKTKMSELNTIYNKNNQFSNNEQSDIVNISPKKKKMVLQMHIKDPERINSFKKNMSRFNITFPPKTQQINKRRNSASGQLQTIDCPEKISNIMLMSSQIQVEQKGGSIQGHRRRYSYRDFRVQEVLSFFKKIKQDYNHKSQKIDQIYQFLHYDIIEKKLKKHIIEDQAIQSLILPKKFGPFGELWEDRKAIVKNNSLYGHFPSYQQKCLIVKGNDDLRQEWIIMQMIKKFDIIFKEAKLPLQLRPYEIIVTSHNSGILEMMTDTLSIDALKKKLNGKNLFDFFTETYKYNFEEAQKNFIESLAAYSILCYLLQIKDRHNGNILIDADGHIIHIDFGFVFTTSPGGNINFESAPFKFTLEYAAVMGGKDSDMYRYFKNCIVRGFMELKKHVNEIVYLIQIMAEQSDLACFQTFNIVEFRQRFFENSTDSDYMVYVDKLVEQSYDNWRTNQYDSFQKVTNGYLP